MCPARPAFRPVSRPPSRPARLLLGAISAGLLTAAVPGVAGAAGAAGAAGTSGPAGAVRGEGVSGASGALTGARPADTGNRSPAHTGIRSPADTGIRSPADALTAFLAGLDPTRPERRALLRVNTRRLAAGCGALAVDPHLQRAAHTYAAEMVRTRTFSHTSAGGLGPTERARAAGWSRGGVGENISMGFRDDPHGVVDDREHGWMHSDGHRANLLDCDWTRTGMGYDPGTVDPAYAAGSWVQLFG